MDLETWFKIHTNWRYVPHMQLAHMQTLPFSLPEQMSHSNMIKLQLTVAVGLQLGAVIEYMVVAISKPAVSNALVKENN